MLRYSGDKALFESLLNSIIHSRRLLVTGPRVGTGQISEESGTNCQIAITKTKETDLKAGPILQTHQLAIYSTPEPLGRLAATTVNYLVMAYWSTCAFFVGRRICRLTLILNPVSRMSPRVFICSHSSRALIRPRRP
jgi:hypothetical protein